MPHIRKDAGAETLRSPALSNVNFLLMGLSGYPGESSGVGEGGTLRAWDSRCLSEQSTSIF